MRTEGSRGLLQSVAARLGTAAPAHGDLTANTDGGHRRGPATGQVVITGTG